jgi:tetratricopeptide (TPR) repeat protein
MRLLVAIAMAVAVPLWAWAQSDPLAEMRRLLDEGFYALAAQFEGPRLLAEHPELAEVHFLYAYALYLSGDARAGDALRRALELSGEPEPDYIWLEGLLRAQEGDFAAAKRLLEHAFTLSQAYVIAMDWGRIAWQDGDFAGALRAFEAAAQTEAGRCCEPWPHLNRGRILLAQGRYQEALAAFDTALDILDATDTGGGLPSPAYVEAFFHLGEAYEALGDVAAATANYEAARSTDPTHGPTLAALARLHPRSTP